MGLTDEQRALLRAADVCLQRAVVLTKMGHRHASAECTYLYWRIRELAGFEEGDEGPSGLEPV